MHKILITGASGFVGSRLIESLRDSREWEIYALTRKSNLARIKQNDRLAGVFTYEDPSFWKDYTFHALIHCAGKAHDIQNVSHPEEYDRVNYELTKEVFNCFETTGGSSFIFLSSVKAAADHVERILDEHAVPSPQTPYGKSKLRAEDFLQQKMQTSGKKICILRPCVIYGPGNKGNLNLLYNFAKRGLPWPFGNFSNERSFLYIDNLVFVIKEVIEGKVSGGIYNVADNGYISTNDLFGIVSKAVNGKARIWNVPRGVVKGLAKAGDFLHLPLNSGRLEKLTGNYRVCNEKIRKAMGKNMPFDMRHGLRLTFSKSQDSVESDWPEMPGHKG